MMEVPHFDRTELNRCISYYTSEKWFNKRKFSSLMIYFSYNWYAYIVDKLSD